MGKRRDIDRINGIFEDLRANGKLDKPAIKRPKPQTSVGKPKWVKNDPRNKCCVVKSDNLPAGFRQCHGCPCNADEFRDLTSPGQESSLRASSGI